MHIMFGGIKWAMATLMSAWLVLPAAAQEDEAVIETGKTVAFDYTLSLGDGSVVQQSPEGAPLEYVHGEQEILPALEDALTGLAVGEEKSVTLSPEQGYGPVNEAAFQEVPIEQVPEDARRVGAELSAPGYEGPIRVHEVGDQTIVLDFNHPLAGETLTFAIRVVSIQ
jgi:FKBP-type peptidyl-prolyl cis-trans isomerase 2